MAFSQTSIVDVGVVADGPDLFVSWSSTSPVGAIFQVYLDRRLAWYGVSRRCHLPIPSGGIGRNIWVEVCTVGADEQILNNASNLVAPGGRSERANLSWLGGTYLDPTGGDDIQGFWIYQSPAAVQPLDQSMVVDSVIAYPGGWINDGFGKNGFGEGGFGRAATIFQWQSGALNSGVWQFAVAPFDKAGNSSGIGQSVIVTISAAPEPPQMNDFGLRLTSNFTGPNNPQLTLNWLKSTSE